jgi:hypothetical protein
MVQQTNKNGDKKRQFPEMLVCTALQQNKISKIKLSGVSDLFADTKLTENIIQQIFIAHFTGDLA